MDKSVIAVDKPLSLMKHLEELRRRILLSLLLIVICAAVVYAFIPQVMALLVRSVGKLYFMSPTEAFWVQIKLAFFIGLYCSLPFVFYQAWRFVEIGLKRREKRFVVPQSVASFLLFTIGGGFCYIFVVPIAVRFLLSYGSPTLIPLISVSRYVSFIGCLVFAFGIAFQLPLVVMFLGRLGVVNSSSLRRFRRFAIVGSFIIGAALTPTPDMVNQTILAVPVIILYELSVWLVRIFERRSKDG